MQGIILPSSVLIKDLPTEEKTAGGIIIPTTQKKPTLKGEVVLVGSGTQDNPIPWNVGKIVLYNATAGRIIEKDGEELRLINSSEILYEWE